MHQIYLWFADSGDEVYGSGRLEGQGGPLDNMRALEHYLPETGTARGSYADNKGNLVFQNEIVFTTDS